MGTGWAGVLLLEERGQSTWGRAPPLQEEPYMRALPKRTEDRKQHANARASKIAKYSRTGFGAN